MASAPIRLPALSLYPAGKRNITFSMFDGKWTPGFNYVVRIVAHTDNKDLGTRAYSSSDPVSFKMTVPRELTICCQLYRDCRVKADRTN